MRDSLYERKVSLVDGLSLQGASLEEIAYFLNENQHELQVFMEMECIDIHHSKLTESDKDGIEEMKTDFIINLSKEGYSDKEIAKLFHIPVNLVSYYKIPFTDINELNAIMERIMVTNK